MHRVFPKYPFARGACIARHKRDDHCANFTSRERGAVLSGSSLKNSENKAVANAIAAEITNTL